MLSVKQGSINYRFLVFGMIRPGIEHKSTAEHSKDLCNGAEF